MFMVTAIIFVAIAHRANGQQTQVGTGLNADGPQLTLDGKPFRIFSGAMHYFRIPAEYWEDRLKKLKECGLNTVETYTAWNLHERNPGEFDFTGRLDLARYLSIASDLGLKVILRPGPYICGEWEWGGHPSWLMQYRNISVRTMCPVYTGRVEKYFDKLTAVVNQFQHSKGGPIIAVQVENEYGAYGDDKTYLRWLARQLAVRGVTELLFTSDGPIYFPRGELPELFAVVNWQRQIGYALDTLAHFRPGKPLMVGEFWTGWFDHWGLEHSGFPVEDFQTNLEIILNRNASFNLYMFHGGTNFALMNGANRVYPDNYHPGDKPKYGSTVTSYDYDCLLDEGGHPTEKYFITQNLMQKYNPDFKPTMSQEDLNLPKWSSYPSISLISLMTIDTYLHLIAPYPIMEPDFMEHVCLDVTTTVDTDKNSDRSFNFCRTQNFGVAVYKKQLTVDPNMEFTLGLEGEVADRYLIMINKNVVESNFIEPEYAEISRNFNIMSNYLGKVEILIMVENMGRVNYETYDRQTLNNERKGFKGHVTLNNDRLTDWKYFALDFNSLVQMPATDQKPVTSSDNRVPRFYYGVVNIDEVTGDTFIDMKNFNQAIVLWNGRNLGRYWGVGPQRTLYLPGAWIEKINQIVIFEQDPPSTFLVKLDFIEMPILDAPVHF